jgi:hypothetical protein
MNKNYQQNSHDDIEVAHLLQNYLNDLIKTLQYFSISEGFINFHCYLENNHATFDINIFKNDANAVESLRDFELAQEYFKWLDYIDNKYQTDKEKIANHMINQHIVEPIFSFNLNHLDDLRQQFYGEKIQIYLEKSKLNSLIGNEIKTTNKQVKL